MSETLETKAPEVIAPVPKKKFPVKIILLSYKSLVNISKFKNLFTQNKDPLCNDAAF